MPANMRAAFSIVKQVSLEDERSGVYLRVTTLLSDVLTFRFLEATSRGLKPVLSASTSASYGKMMTQLPAT